MVRCTASVLCVTAQISMVPISKEWIVRGTLWSIGYRVYIREWRRARSIIDTGNERRVERRNIVQSFSRLNRRTNGDDARCNGSAKGGSGNSGYTRRRL